MHKLFSIEDYNETHKILTIMGLKIKYAKHRILKIKQTNPFYYYKKKHIDITKLPPAQGRLREIQLANLALLDELDYICKQNNLTYWLDGGTLLGAYRHKGFIPWDDDIDTAMLIDDYNKLVPIFNKYSRNPDIYAQYYRDSKKKSVYFIKIRHKKCPHLFVDIFPFYRFGKSMDKKKQLKLSCEIKNIRKEMDKQISRTLSLADLKQKIEDTMEQEVLTKAQIEGDIRNSDYIWGIQYNHGWNNWFASYDMIFPLKNIEFEGKEYPANNNPPAFLEKVYGDFMDYPSKITFGHAAYKKIGKNEIEIIKELANQKGI